MGANLTPQAKYILEQRYLRRDENGDIIETPEQLFERVARAVSNGEPIESDRQIYFQRFYDLMTSLKFLPNSPTLVNAGVEGKGCLSACFVCSPEEDTMESILQTQKDWGMIEKWGGGVGIGLSIIRPKGDRISTTHGKALGPVAIMHMLSTNAKHITQGSFRLGAHMAQLAVSHNDIFEFIHCKDKDDTLENFNISVQITDEFMQALEKGEDWHLVNSKNNEVMQTIPAKQLWQEICGSAWKTGDPGVVFIDRVWETAPNPQLGGIQTSNPCGEEFLENYSNCCLGSIDLSKFVIEGKFDFEDFDRVVYLAIRFLNDVIEVNTFPIPHLREMNLKTRRIGLGVMGFADALIKLGLPYDSEAALGMARLIGKKLKNSAWLESFRLADERGAYSEYKNSSLKYEFKNKPVRNSSVITIAPTGTISRLANCSSGIEPCFDLAYWSNILWTDHDGKSTKFLDVPSSVKDVLERDWGAEKVNEILIAIANNPEKTRAILKAYYGINADIFRTAMEISPEWHVKMQAAWQENVTNSVSKTINLPEDATVNDVSEAFKLAWELKCKAVTVYRDKSKSMQVLNKAEGLSELVKVIDNIKLVVKDRPAVMTGVTEKVKTGHGNAYVTINFEGTDPFELFTTLGKAGGCDSANLEAISRLVSLAFRYGIDTKEVIAQLKGITCCPVWNEGTMIKSTADGIAYAISKNVLKEDEISYNNKIGGSIEKNGHLVCIQCGGELIRKEGCIVCKDCSWTRCE